MGLMHKDFHSENGPPETRRISDIYSFDMVMLEVLTSYPPYYNISHSANLVIGICKKGLNLKLKNGPPETRRISDIYSFDMVMLEVLTSYPPYYNISHRFKPEIKCEIPQSNKNFIQYDPNEIHPEAIYFNIWI
ncbi:hypothetical protein Glove_110g137 [Diversispora epigaea]|uniref:Protein kinase domain-containing protein n=1 Tax=Diversispora epigaea TaxID=1348612 RepID=A0A397JBZ2_9GLOM|nr:hypothetical protein Glove_110g137 [Diversispora epigaea]